ncbi:MAG: hypothetical protein ACSHWZ_15025 [Sulfitobacter sp.]
MTNRIALFLGLFLVLGMVIDGMLFGDSHFIYLGKKFADLVEWLAFWR